MTTATSARKGVRLMRDAEQLRAWGAETDNAVAVGDPSPRSGAVEVRVHIKGPPDTPYEGGDYSLLFTVGSDYPFKSPSVGFCTPIWHPNIDHASGSVCLDVLTAKRWMPAITLRDIAEAYIPQLLQHPEPADPLNHDAAAMLSADAAAYAAYTRLHCRKFARGEADVTLPAIEAFAPL